MRLVPGSRAFSIGPTDVGSWVGFATVFLSFLGAGMLQARWLRSRAIGVWVLLGPLLFAVAAYHKGLNVSSCLRRLPELSHLYRISCGMVTATMLLPLLGALTGFLALRLWRYFVPRGQFAV